VRVEGGVAASGWNRDEAPPGNPHRAAVSVLERELERQRALAAEWDEGFSNALKRKLTRVERERQAREEVWLASRITVCELDQEE
jgi:hypothetical protein